MNLEEMIHDYWTGRADEFCKNRLADLLGLQHKIWTNLLREYIPDGHGLQALDIGTGGGFFAVVLAKMGYDVTAVDFSKEMLENAAHNARETDCEGIRFLQMDAQRLLLEDSSFDLVISRNVMWSLPHADETYGEWSRVLKPGGKLLNFDANYGQTFKKAEAKGETYREMQSWVPSSYHRAMQSAEQIRTRNAFATRLDICDTVRPQWDVAKLIASGMQKIELDLSISDRVYADVQISEGKLQVTRHKNFGSDAQMFLVCATK